MGRSPSGRRGSMSWCLRAAASLAGVVSVVCLLAYVTSVYRSSGSASTVLQQLEEGVSSLGQQQQQQQQAGDTVTWDLAVDEEWMSWMPAAIIEEDDHMMLSSHHLSLYHYLSPTPNLARFRWSKWQRSPANPATSSTLTVTATTELSNAAAATPVGVQSWSKVRGKPRLEWIANPCVNSFGKQLGLALPSTFRVAEQLLQRYIAETEEDRIPDYMDLLIDLGNSTSSLSTGQEAGGNITAFYSPHQSALWGGAAPMQSNVTFSTLTLYVGCYVEGDPPLFDVQLEAKSNVRRCAARASRRGARMFALREHGECWAARDNELDMADVSKYGQSDQCSVDCDATRVSRRRERPLRHVLAGQLCGNTMVNSVYRIVTVNSTSFANPWLMDRLGSALVIPDILTHSSVRRSPPPAVFQLRSPGAPSLEHKEVQVQLASTLHTKLRMYARFLYPPWKPVSVLPSVPPAFQPAACDLNMCRTTCCCHPCLTTLYQHPPADNQILFPDPLSSLGPSLSQADAALDEHSWQYFNASRDSAPPPLPLPILPRIALLLSGEMRSFASSFPWTKYHLLDKAPYPVDVFVHAWADDSTPYLQAALQANGVEAKGFLIDPLPPFPLDLAGLIDCRKADAVDNTVLVLSSESLRRAHRMKRLEEQRLGGKYSWVIRMRFDIVPRHSFWPEVAQLMGWDVPAAFTLARRLDSGNTSESSNTSIPAGWNMLRPAPVSNGTLPVEHLVYPACGHWGGLNDQFAMGTSDAMHGYCEKPRYIHRCMLWGLGAGWHPEFCHLAALDTAAEMINLMVSELPVCYAIIRPSGFDRRGEKVLGNMCQFKQQDTALQCCNKICIPDTDACLPVALTEPHDPEVRCLPGEAREHCAWRVRMSHAC